MMIQGLPGTRPGGLLLTLLAKKLCPKLNLSWEEA